MSLEAYVQKFRQLNVARRDKHSSPHKVCLLLAVMDLTEAGVITDNRIMFNESLLEKFRHHFDLMRLQSDQFSPYLPFYHLKNDGFWHHHLHPGKQAEYDNLAQSNSQKRVQDCIVYAYLDDELFDYFKHTVSREPLKQALFDNIDSAGREDLRGAIGGWSRLECELIVQDYLDMFIKELKGEKYSKAQHRRRRQPKLDQRTEGSIEYKHQNISGVLIDLEFPYIIGYKPAFNYQQLLKEVVSEQLVGQLTVIENSADDLITETPPPTEAVDWDSVWEQAPELVRDDHHHKAREYQPRQYNFSERESRNRKLGLRGEEFIIEYEKHRLHQLGRSDLAKSIEWTSKTKGDGAGCDIRSFRVGD